MPKKAAARKARSGQHTPPRMTDAQVRLRNRLLAYLLRERGMATEVAREWDVAEEEDEPPENDYPFLDWPDAPPLSD